MTNRLIGVIPKHLTERNLRSPLSRALREKFGRRNLRVIAGDTIKVIRGEYSGIEGKVEKVNMKRGSLAIEGIQREKVRGGNVKVEINSTNVIITDLDLGDKYRQALIQRQHEIEKKNPSEKKHRIRKQSKRYSRSDKKSETKGGDKQV
ncbi:MAG TPA: 50S ribosomal protein L24 [Nitrososphaeraceae archaeon]|nr:50S ribosomal protein L24 [Nitrososphaeraceae archaeon]